jgi:sigma-B regulation protein RsbU (phosphoserine phosphatase)
MHQTERQNKNAQYLGTYNKPGFNITILAKTPLTRAMRATYIVTEKSILLGLMIIGIGIILAFILANSITAPLFYLYEATKEIAKGNFKPKLDIKSKDEIGSLSKSFTSMSEEIDNLIKQKVKSIHLEKEVEVASAVQQTLIPDQAYESDKLKIFSHYQSASQCGGDLWNHFEYQNKAVMMIADATGHGIPSALITASARSCMSVIQQLIEDKTIVNFTAADILKVANRVIQDASKGKIYMTMFVAIIDFDSEKINYSNAGHNPPWLFRESSKPMTLMIPSSRLGENPVAKFENKEVAFLPDDLLFMYTDGLLEGTNLKKEQFGKKEVRRIIEEQLKNPNPNFKEPKSIVMTLISRFLSFSGQQNGKPKALDDDITIVMTKLKGGSNE